MGLSLNQFVDAGWSSKAADRRSVSRGITRRGCVALGVSLGFQVDRNRAVSKTDPNYVTVEDVIKEVAYLKAGMALHVNSCQHAVHTGVGGQSGCGGACAEPYHELKF